MFSPLVYALLGLIIGSFLNVLVLRSFTGRSLAGRSGCLSCKAGLPVWTLVPVVSWIFLRGRCHQCGSAISLQYPLVEITTALVFFLVGVHAGWLPFLVQALLLLLAALWVAIAVYDIRHTIVPDSWAYAAAGVALLARVFFEGASAIPDVAVGALVVALPLFLLWHFSHGRAMGLGDAKLGISIGALLGVAGGFSALVFSFVFGALVSLIILLPLPWYKNLYTRITKKGLSVPAAGLTMKSEVPFGPFLVLGAFSVWLFSLDIFTINMLLSDAALLLLR